MYLLYFSVNRGPNKRQIKPAGNNSLLQLALGEDSEDSEEDADFELNDDEDDDEGADIPQTPLSLFDFDRRVKQISFWYFMVFFLSFCLKLSHFLNTKVQFCCWALPWICLFAKFCILFLSVICDKWFHFVLVLDLLEGEHFRPRLLFFLI